MEGCKPRVYAHGVHCAVVFDSSSRKEAALDLVMVAAAARLRQSQQGYLMACCQKVRITHAKRHAASRRFFTEGHKAFRQSSFLHQRP